MTQERRTDPAIPFDASTATRIDGDTTPHCVGRLRGLNESAPSGESDLARRAREIVAAGKAASSAPGAAPSGDYAELVRQRNLAGQNGSIASNIPGLRGDDATGAEEQLSVEDQRAAEDERMISEGRSAEYRAQYLEAFDKAHAVEDLSHAKSEGRHAGQNHAAANHVALEEAAKEQRKDDDSSESAVSRVQRENDERARDAWRNG